MTIYKQNQEIAKRHIEDTILLVNTETDTIFYLNSMSAAIWQLIDKPIEAGEAITIVQQAFPEILPQKIAEDVSNIFEELWKRNLVISCE